MARRVFVISDLHLAGSERGFFSAGKELEEFIQYVKGIPGAVDLVILGDALDYLQIKPYLSFNKTDVENKTEAIIKNNIPFFKALQDLISATGKKILWAIGNHDVELVFPIARAKIQEKIFGTCDNTKHDELTWYLDGTHIDYQVAHGATIRLVHGNQGEGWNAVDYEAAQAAADSGDSTQFTYPVGSKLVADVLNPLVDQGFQHVHLLKPEASVALPLSLALWPEDTRALLAKAWPLPVKKKFEDVKGWLAQTFGTASKPTFGATLEAPVPPPVAGQVLAEALRAAITSSAMPIDDALVSDISGWLVNDNVEQALERYLRPLEPGKTKKFEDSWIKNVFTSLFQGAAHIANSWADPWSIDQEDELTGPVQRSFSVNQVAVLIAGHTHLARAVSYNNGYYINTGTWADLMRIPRPTSKQDFKDYARGLREYLKSPATCPWELRPFRRLTYVEIELPGGGSQPYRVSLKEWPTESPKNLYQCP